MTGTGEALDAIARLADLELRGLPFKLRLWDGTFVYASEQRGAPTVVVRDPRAIAHLLRAPGELGLARAWVSGQLELDGDLEDVLRLCERARRMPLGWRDRARLAAFALTAAGPTALRRPSIPACEARERGLRHTLARDRRAISHHYDVSNRFYELLLGPSMCSSSAYFDSAEDSLDAAQERKLELICRKLHLAPGERLLDVLPRLSTLVCAFERSGLEVRRIESLREHYQRTVRGWHSNLAARRDEALAEIGAERVRTWQLYLLGSAFAFAFADITVFQVFCGRPAGGEA